ncbi:MAG TPA: rhomboid family intramembrane serine protease [Kofleriaceae bacterium]|nr:rhomboid family intramembrane serine protease [Kofleriaceae bacterium]
MYYELALISVVVAGGYWGWYFVRQGTLRTYGVMQLATAALAGLGLLGRKLEVAELGIAGAVGVGGGACLLVLGPLARGLARRAAAAERFGIAERLLDVAEVLAPGSGVADEKALLGAMREIRDGNIEQTVDALTAAKDRAPADARLAIDERIAMLYLAAYRWDDAIAHAEANLFGAVPPAAREAAGPPQVALRRALGIAPPVWVELLGAYGYKGDLDQAARMLVRLEDVCAGRDDAQIWLHRGRLIFLALAGRIGAVQTLVEPRRSRHMSRAARTYWIGVAHERRGDGAAAEAAYERARSGSRGRPRVLIDRALERLATAQPVELGPTASEVVARVEAAPPPSVVSRARPRGPIATRVLTGAVVATAAAIALAFGDSNDVGVLVRAGAMVRGSVTGGEWWRLVSCVFVHVGGVHLIVNAIGLWFLGRLAEDLLGSWRTAAIFAVSGIAGAVASYLASPAGVSAGASGAIFGLLGAVFVELTWHRARHRTAWNRGVWGSIAVVTVAQIGIGFMYPAIDEWAHGAGLLIGALAGGLMSPNAHWARAGQVAARALAVAFAAVSVFAAVMVSRTTIADTLTRAPMTRHVIGPLAATAPADWRSSKTELYDPSQLIDIELDLVPGTRDDLARWIADEPRRAHADQIDQIAIATDALVPLPPGWQGEELVVTEVDALGGTQRLRVVVAGKEIGGRVIELRLFLPETMLRAAPHLFADILASLELA